MNIHLKRWHVRLLFALAIAIMISAIAFPYLTYISSKSESSVMGDLNVIGFDVTGYVDIDYAIGRVFTFIEHYMTVNIACQSSTIQGLKVLVSSKTGQDYSVLDTSIFSASGKLDIALSNLDIFSYEDEGQNTSSSMRMLGTELSAFLMAPTFPTASLTLWRSNTTSSEARASIFSSQRTASLFLWFGAINGSLSISGDESFSYPLVNQYAGIMVNVTNLVNRSYIVQVQGDINQVQVEDWDLMKCTFYHTIDNTINNITSYSPKGDLAYNKKEAHLSGSQDLFVNDFTGTAYITPTNDSFFYRLVLNGESASIIVKSASASSDLTERSILDILVFWPIFFISLSLAIMLLVVRTRLNLRIGTVVLIPFIIFLLGSLVWAIKTEQPAWLQNLLGYTPFIFAVLVFLMEQKEKNDKK
jgi:hypothetical protein